MSKRAMVQAKRFILAKRYDGMPKLTDFKLEELTLPALKDGEVLVEAKYFSIDAGMRAYSNYIPVGATMLGAQVAKIIESKNSDYPLGAHMYGVFGWRTHTIFDPKDTNHIIPPYILPSFGNLPLSLGLGHLGMPGNTAYFGFLEICKPKAGEVVVVSGAAGSVGNLVGQIAKIKGCTVIGIVGSDDKCEWIKKDCGYDHAINYKKEKVGEALKKLAPKGVNCYFDNVGGEISSEVIEQMAEFGRISICGAVSVYNYSPDNYPKVPVMQPTFVQKQLKMEGFHVKRFAKQWFEGIKQLKDWTEEGKIKYHETTVEGFENTPQTFIDVLNGKNTGKAVVKV